MNNTLINNIINKFIDYISNEKRMSKHTVDSYLIDLRDFYQYIENTYPNKEINCIDNVIVRSWISEMMDEGKSKTTINRKLSCLRSYFKFATKRNLLENDPTKGISGLKKDKNLPNFLTEKELMSIIENEDGATFESVRDKITIILLAGTGLRRSELTSLKIDSIDFPSSIIKVRGKRDKERLIPIGKYIKDNIYIYIGIRDEYLKEKEKKDEGWLLISNSGNKPYPEMIYRIVKKKIATIHGNGSPHILRHTFATLLLNKGSDINSVKELLGHESLSATQIYTHNTIEKIKKTYRDAHPRANY